MTPAARKAELDHANAVAQQIAELYLGEVRNLPGTGLLVHFRASDDSGRALQVVCAAFALTQLFEEFEALDAGAYRLGLHTIGIPVGGELHNDAPELADAALLSALAKRGTIAVSGCFPMQTLRPDQVRSQPLQHPLLDDLDTVASAHLVTGLSPLQQALVTRQVTRLSNQWGTTESESTF